MNQKRARQLRKLSVSLPHYSALKKSWNSMSWVERDRMLEATERPLRAPRTNDYTKVE